MHDYPYYDAATGGVQFDAMIDCLEQPAGEKHRAAAPCCHNPTGVDLSRTQWDQVIALVVEKNLIPFMDIAYQGFGDGLEEDAYAIRAMVAAGVSFFVSNSFSRTSPSTASAVAACRSSARMPKRASRVLGQMKATVRRNYSSPPPTAARSPRP